MDRLLTIEPLDLILKLELGKKYHATIQLKNVMHTMPVAFLVQPSTPKRYTIKPALGIIAPLEAIAVIITLTPQSEIPTSVPYSTDKFVVKSIVVPGSSKHDPIPLDWFTASKKQVYSDHGIRVFFVGGCILRKIVDAGCMEAIREVLELDEKLVDSKDEHGSTALHAAVASVRPDLVQLLLEFKANVNAKNKKGHTALHEAAVCGEALIAELLLAKGANVNARTLIGSQTALRMAVSTGHAEVAKLLVENGADVNESTGDGMTLLHMALDEARYDCLELLLQMGVDPNVKTKGKHGDAPLHWAVEREDNKAVEILLKHGACKELKNKSGKTPADLAREKGQKGHVFSVAVAFGDDFRRGLRIGNVTHVQESLRKGMMLAGEADEHGWTTLHTAASKGHMEVACTLIDAGADVECTDDAGYTPLHCAVEAGNKDIVKLLLKHGAPVNAGTCSGVTALDLAAAFEYSGIVSLLLEWGGCSGKVSKAQSKDEEGIKGVGQHVAKDVKERKKGRDFKEYFGFSLVKQGTTGLPASTDAGTMATYAVQ